MFDLIGTWLRFYPKSLLGTTFLFLAASLILYTLVIGILGIRKRSERFIRSAERAMYAVTVILSLTILQLAMAFYQNDFTLEYVAQHSSSELPRIYAVTALWAGQSGSLLFWVWILSLYTAVVLYTNRFKRRTWLPYVVVILAFVEGFFLFTNLFGANPFLPPPDTIGNGMGMNPILQHPLMLAHPPNLYLGYVGFTIPFAFAIAGLFTGKMGQEWLTAIRRWAIIPWFFLTVGIIMGSRWAYVELGWGGYWAWDPVENASFMPWLLSTAYLHSIMIQEKKNMLRAWNLFLIIATFLMAILGTFITRSGILSSVHAFAVSRIGDFFVVFLAFVLFYSLAIVYIRWPIIRSERRIESFLSKESSFLFNNLLLVGICFTVLWGTLFPLISDLVKGHRITVAAPFFNAVTAPIGFALLILTGICPLIAWRRASWSNFQKNLLYPFTGTLLFATVLFALGIRKAWPLAFASASFFVLATIILEFYRGVRARRQLHGEGRLKAFWKLLVKHPRRYGGYIVHFGIVFIFFGITGTAFYQVKKEVNLKPSQAVELEGYQLLYKGLESQRFMHKESVRARTQLIKKGETVATLFPGQDFHFNADQPVSEVAIHSGLWGDVYVVFAGTDNDGSVTFQIYYNPLINWLWFGGILILFGGIVIFNPQWEPAYYRVEQWSMASPGG